MVFCDAADHRERDVLNDRDSPVGLGERTTPGQERGAASGIAVGHCRSDLWVRDRGNASGAQPK